MTKVLLKDIVIPAGTLFSATPKKREYVSDSFVECTIGLTKNTSGHFAYDIEAEVSEWFADIK